MMDFNAIVNAHAKVTETVAPKTYRGWSISWDYGNFYAVHPDYDASWEGPEDGWVDNGLQVFAPDLDSLYVEIDEKQSEWNEANGRRERDDLDDLDDADLNDWHERGK